MTEEFKVLKSNEVRIQGLHGDELKKCAALAQQLADVSAQLTLRKEALKEIQNELQLQKERVTCLCPSWMGKPTRYLGHTQNFTRTGAIIRTNQQTRR
jgi:hypothetical protein